MSLAIDPLGNHLIAALSSARRPWWTDQLEWVDMPLGTVLYESGSTMNYVYFPVTAMVSLLYVTEAGASSEIALVGNEGVVGISLFMGGGSTSSRGVVQYAGQGFRMKARALKGSFDGCPEVQLLLLKYTQSLMTQMSQTAVCNRHHSLEAQLCKRLLLSLDRLPGMAVTLTQELIANMLGVRREGVSVAAFRLQRDGLIRYSRGCIEVLDRAGLERRTCECYGVVKRECNRLLPEASPAIDARGTGLATRRPVHELTSMLASCAQAAQTAKRDRGSPPERARAQRTAIPRTIDDARSLPSRVDSNLSAAGAFMAMRTIVSNAHPEFSVTAA